MKGNQKRKRPDIQSRVAKEAGKSFEAVVKDYAMAGHSMTETSFLLGYAHHTGFIRLCERHGWTEWFKKGENSIGGQRARRTRRGVCTPGLKRATSVALKNNPMCRPFEYQGVLDTWTGHARRAGISVNTMWSRKQRRPDDLEYIFSKRSHSKIPSTENHIWRKQYAES